MRIGCRQDSRCGRQAIRKVGVLRGRRVLGRGRRGIGGGRKRGGGGRRGIGGR